MKLCIDCNIEKDFCDFPKREDSIDGYRTICKKCFYEKNKKKSIEYLNEYNKNNKEKINSSRRHREKIRRKNDKIYKLQNIIRSSLNKAIKDGGYTKKSRTHEILGCSFDVFKLHIEKQFENWMNWDNHGIYKGEYNETWQLDHIIPISSAKSEEELLKIYHYTNYQPLCSKINLIDKNIKLDYKKMHF